VLVHVVLVAALAAYPLPPYVPGTQGPAPVEAAAAPVAIEERLPPSETEEAPRVSERLGCEESDEDFDWRRRTRRRAFVLPGLSVTVAGLLVFALARDWDHREENVDDGPTCMIGKPCGNSCIAVNLECHKGTGTANYAPLTTGGWVAGSLLVLAGIGLMIGGLVAPARMERRRVRCSASGCGLVLRF